MRILQSFAVLVTIALWSGSALANHVQIENSNGKFKLLVDEKPYQVKGAGGTENLALLAASGGNTIRTWGIDNNTATLLDEAHKNGLKVVLGIWMGHPRLGFNYHDQAQVQNQFERAREAVLKHKDHPALLMWSVGNEMELKTDPANRVELWNAVNEIALMIKALDPHHPTMTITSDLGIGVVEAIRDRCPGIDIHGINSYGGASSLPERYRDAGGSKPFMLTEFGPTGIWEMSTNKIGTYTEETSTAKAARYRYVANKLKSDPMSLGSFAFLWGHKQEVTSTWFGMLLPDGSRLAAVDAMTEVWTGQPPVNRVPIIESYAFDKEQIAPGEYLRAKVTLSDPEGDPVTVEWQLVAEGKEFKIGGDREVSPEKFPDAVIESDSRHAVIRAPDEPGLYRVFVFAQDGHGGAATANLPVLVIDDKK